MERYRVEFKKDGKRRYHTSYVYGVDCSDAVKQARKADHLKQSIWDLIEVRAAPEIPPDRRLPREDD